MPSPAPTCSPAQPETSALAICLERCWRTIQNAHPELPSAIIIVASGQEHGRLVKHGHWSPARWVVEAGKVPEVLIAGETLNREPVQVFGTLLHEAAHGLAFARKVKDTSRNGRYHNEKYKVIAESVGLTVAKDETHGWTITALTPAAASTYKDCIAAIKALPQCRRRLDREPAEKKTEEGEEEGGETEGKGGEEEGRKESRSLLATCECGRKVRVSRKVIDAGLIACALCHTPFSVEPPTIRVRTVVVGLAEAEEEVLLREGEDPAAHGPDRGMVAGGPLADHLAVFRPHEARGHARRDRGPALGEPLQVQHAVILCRLRPGVPPQSFEAVGQHDPGEGPLFAHPSTAPSRHHDQLFPSISAWWMSSACVALSQR